MLRVLASDHGSGCVDLFHEILNHLFNSLALENKINGFFSINIESLISSHLLVHLEKLYHILKRLESLSALVGELLTVLEFGPSLH